MNFVIPQRGFFTVPADTTIGGGDIALPNGKKTVTAAGDWAVITGRDAAEQSVIRETLAPKGSLPRRPRWGRGVAALMFKGATKATRDAAVAATRAGMLANPRIRSVTSVSATPSQNGQGTVLSVQGVAVDGPISVTTVIKPGSIR